MNQQPLFVPSSDWKPPSELPDLTNAKVIGVDTETRDPNLTKLGPGFIRGEADVRGFSVATEDRAWFFPLYYPEDNYHNPRAAIEWLKDLCKQDREYVFHNAMYDIEGLNSLDIEVRGTWHDTMVYEALLVETESTNLEATAARRVQASKDEAALREAAASYMVDPKSQMYLLPARYVGSYGEQDAALPVAILKKQMELIAENDLESVRDLESRLLPATWYMRKHGVRVDVEEAHRLDEAWRKVFQAALIGIKRGLGWEPDIWSPKHLVKVCEQLKIEYNRTPKGNPSFENEWFEQHAHPTLQLLAEARQYDKMRRDFLDGQIFRYEHNGRIHGQFHTTRRDDGGTRSGRFSSSNPNLQQVPARHPVFGAAIRSLFLPDEGGTWGKFDYSSQEPRITLHFAYQAGIRSAEEFVDKYRRDPRFCQHSYAADVLRTDRSTCKGVNLGLTYGMGRAKLARQLGITEAEAGELFTSYNRELPFVSGVAKHYTRIAERTGMSRTELGRIGWFPNTDYCYKALNRAVQGTGADLMKMAIVLVYEELGPVPLLTVHDETNYTIYEEEDAIQISEIMENAIPMTVPQVVDPELGKNWGDCK